jgi:SAM-dependent methyltransferase
MESYVHGYTDREALRLNDQSDTLEDLLHYDSVWSDGSLILEAGCGTGAQTKIIATKNKNSKFISLDISEESIRIASSVIDSLNLKNVSFQTGNIFSLPFPNETFDHILLCFVLEHLNEHHTALNELKRVLKTNGTITIIEGDHGSAYFYPDSEEAKLAINCQVELQKSAGGDANIGRKLFPILNSVGFKNVNVSPRMVYVDDSKPELVEGFTKNTFTAMIEGIREKAIKENLIDERIFDKGISDLQKTTAGNGVFCYTFFKAVGIKH